MLPSVFVLYAGYRYGWGQRTVGLTLGLAPGEPLRESKLHLRYSTDW